VICLVCSRGTGFGGVRGRGRLYLGSQLGTGLRDLLATLSLHAMLPPPKAPKRPTLPARANGVRGGTYYDHQGTSSGAVKTTGRRSEAIE